MGLVGWMLMWASLKGLFEMPWWPLMVGTIMCVDLCTDMCVHRCTHRCVDVRIDVCIDMCTGKLGDVCIDLRMDTCLFEERWGWLAGC